MGGRRRLKPCQAAAVAATRSGNDREALPGRIRNQMEYMAGRNTKVKIVPAKVPPMSVYASVPQKTEWVSGMNARIAANAVNITGRARGRWLRRLR